MDVPEELKQSLKGEDEETNKTNDSSIHEGNVMDDMLSSQKSNAKKRIKFITILLLLPPLAPSFLVE